MKKLFFILISVCLCASLCSCSTQGTAAPDLPAISGAASSSASVQQSDNTAIVPAEPGDGLEGSYFNDYMDLLLIIDGWGCYEISGSISCTGTYSVNGDSIVFNISGTACHATRDSDGDLLFDVFTGYFLSDWEKWGITEADLNA